MNHETVRIILEKVISSPANVHLADFDEAIPWVEGRGTIRQLDRGTDKPEYSSQFRAPAVEMRAYVGFQRAVGSPEPRSQPNVC